MLQNVGLCRKVSLQYEESLLGLAFNPVDVKALFRRSQAYEKLGQLEEAYQDVRNLIRCDPRVGFVLVMKFKARWGFEKLFPVDLLYVFLRTLLLRSQLED